MRIPITLQDFSSTSATLPPQLARLSSNEIVLIELQGSLEVEGDAGGELIGILKFDEAVRAFIPCILDTVTSQCDVQDRPTLQIGHNLLEGKIVTLTKPLAVLHLVEATQTEAGFDSNANSMQVDDPKDANTSKSFEIVSLIRKKISFPKRPRPLVHGTK